MSQQVIEISQIAVPENRQRKTFSESKKTELIDSIKLIGLLHAVVLRSDGRTLLAGHRRLIAISELAAGGITIKHNGTIIPLGSIPFVTTDQLDPLALEEAELQENICREDLTWQDKSTTIARLHALRLARNPTQTLKQTAEEIADKELPNGGSLVAEVSDAVLIMHHLDDDEVRNAASAKEAKQIITRKLEREFREALAKTLGPEAFRTGHNLIKGDCVEVIKTMPDGKFDCIVTDPPYGIDADDFGTQSQVGHQYTDDVAEMYNLHTVLAPELFRVMKDDSHLYLFCDLERFPKLKLIYQYHGFTVWRTPLIWDKSPTGMLPSPEYGPRRCYEAILYATKGKRPVTAIYGDVLRHPAVAVREHAAQKPVEVYIDLLRRSCEPGASVLDCFCGSGVIFSAAQRLRLIATGIEKDAASYTIAAQTLNSIDEVQSGTVHCQT